MPVINTNYLSLVAQNNLTKSQNTLGSAIEKLSSGLRINSAKDDAAGQAIANRFTANVKGLTQAARNANDGISLAQTTEGALNEINNNLQRIRELTVQASNGTNSGSDLDSIQAEIDQRMQEIDRVSTQTKFNGTSVLTQTDAMKIQVGANDGETIDINLKQINIATLKLTDLSVSGSIGTDDLTEIADTDDAGGSIEFSGGPAGATTQALHSYDDNGTTKYVAEVDGEYYSATYTAGTAEDAAAVPPVDAVPGQVTIGAKIAVATGAGKTATANPLEKIDAALADVDSLRSDLGAVQNRFQSTVNNLNNTINNLSAARSRIEDADYATEVSNMSKAQILQQAGTSVLAQANQVPQSVLSLLQ
ncbi:FliC/FljB family flagellin [Schauerella aestuarii]|uniref:FliC/FljB family flagellin n=1 Tax=Schauerella aestuarii TaxID=2511204 RepID=UPI0013686B43|nr:FliC/FljB family flagellin [Achromobacter aestuarii]MYZ44917.1 FliC/FljB family flagellin [Achromobacter aestuarii]